MMWILSSSPRPIYELLAFLESKAGKKPPEKKLQQNVHVPLFVLPCLSSTLSKNQARRITLSFHSSRAASKSEVTSWLFLNLSM